MAGKFDPAWVESMKYSFLKAPDPLEGATNVQDSNNLALLVPFSNIVRGMHLRGND
jgi:hypothetical protein